MALACGITARALELTGPRTDLHYEPAKRAGLARASAWLGTLPARHSVEQTAALDTVAETLGYDITAVRRTFRARHWKQDLPRSSPERGIDL